MSCDSSLNSPNVRRSPRSRITPLTSSTMHSSLSPEPSVQMLLQISNLKSCLKSRAKIEKSSRKSVIFGSPNVAEFNSTSPTNKMTPMTRNEAKKLFSMNGKTKEEEEEKLVDDLTEENSRILDQWDRLTNVSEGSRESDDDSEFNDLLSPLSVSSSSKSRGRRQSKLQLSADRLNDDTDQDFMNKDINTSEVSNTIALPNSLRELLNDNLMSQNQHHVFDPENDKTENLEGDLMSLLETVANKNDELENKNENIIETSNISNSKDEANGNTSESENGMEISNDYSGEDMTTALELNLGALIDKVVIPVESESNKLDCISSSKLKLAENQNILRQRLQMLNAGARQNSLVQCATPSTINHLNRLSIGMKRQSMIAMASAKKDFTDLKRQRHSSVLENIHPNTKPIQPLTSVNNEKQLKNKISMSDPDQNKPLTLENLYRYSELFFPRMPEQSTNSLPIVVQDIIQSTTSDILQKDLNKLLMDTFHSSTTELTDAYKQIKNKDSVLWNEIDPKNKFYIQKECDQNDSIKSNIKNMSNIAVDYGQKTLIDYERSVMSGILEQLNELKLQKKTEYQNKINEEYQVAQQAKKELESLKQKVEEAQNRVILRKQELVTIHDEIADVLELTKNEMLALVDDKFSAPKDETCNENWLIEKRLMNHQTTSGTCTSCAPSNATEEVMKTVSVLNQLTYCRLISYQCSHIKFEVILTPYMKASLEFKFSEGDQGIVVDEVDFNLISDNSENIVSQQNKNEYELSKEYFSMMQKTCQNCFTECKTPSHIPNSIQMVNGYVCILRKLLTQIENLDLSDQSSPQMESIFQQLVTTKN